MEIHETAQDRGLASKVAAELRAEFARRKLAGRDYAAYAGISQSTISTRLTGRHALDLDELEGICKWLGVNATEIIERALVA